MYRDSCGQTLNRLVHVILAVTLLVFLANALLAQDTPGREASSNSTCAVNPITAEPAPAAPASVSIQAAAPSAIFGATLTAAFNSSSSNAGIIRFAPAPVFYRRPVKVLNSQRALTSSQCCLLADQPS
jgi:hypothetical protein